MNKKRLAINMTASLVSFGVNFIISFFLAPYIIANVGRTAYGFVALGNNFINYATLVTAALNSMASRFITIKIHQNDDKGANRYFNSVIISNMVITLVLLVPCVCIVLFINSIVNVPNNILTDVQLLWTFLFGNFLLGLVTNSLAVSLFASNRLDLSSKRDIESNLIKVGILFLCFYFFTPHIWYLGLASSVCFIYVAVSNFYYTKKLMPQLKFDRSKFDIKAVIELISSGIWNTVSQVGSIALTELDLLISNLLVSGEAMGTLSIAKTMPNYISMLNSKIVSVFLPQLTITYAKADTKEFVSSVKSSIRIILFFNSLSYGVLIAFADYFYKLWLPQNTQDIDYIYLLGIISIAGCFISAVSYLMSNIFTVTNHIKIPSLVILGTGLASILITVLIVKVTNLGLVAVAGVSVTLVAVRNVAILTPYGAKCINQPWYTFFPDLLLNVISILISIGICFVVKLIMFEPNSWMEFLIIVVIGCIAIAIANFFVILRKNEKQAIIARIKKMVRR